MLNTLDYYNIFYKKTGSSTSFFELLASTEETHFTAKFLENSTDYEFVIQAVNKTKTLFSFSNIVECKTMQVVDTLVPVIIDNVSVIEDSYIQIDVITNPFQDPFNKLLLLRYKPEKELLSQNPLAFKVIDSLEYSSTNQYRFKDENANPHSGLYYYMAIAENKCKLNDTSNIITNIFLTGDRVQNEKYKDQITFIQLEVNSSETYDLLVNGQIFSISPPLTVDNNSYIIDVEKLVNESSDIVYQIKSAKDCYSNTIIIPHEPIVYFPNAFYLQGICIDRTFYPIIFFPSEDNYLFIIYNRWGQELYRSTLPPVYNEYNNMQGRWDGNFQGKECPDGIYAYQLSFKYNNGKGKFSKSGSFMLVR